MRGFSQIFSGLIILTEVIILRIITGTQTAVITDRPVITTITITGITITEIPMVITGIITAIPGITTENLLFCVRM